MIRSTATGAEIDVRVIPKSPRTAVDGERDGAVLVRVAAPPVDDAANEELRRYFAGVFGLPRRAVRIVSGDRGRKKRLALDGVTAESARGVIRGLHR